MKDTRQILHEFIGVTRYHRRAFENAVRGMGIHHSGHRILMFLAQNEGTPSQKEIAERFEITPAAVTGTLKKLEKGGYIERRICPEDGRSNRIVLTKKGEEVAEQSKVMFEAVDRQMFEKVTEEEQELLHSCMQQMLANLKKIEEKKCLLPIMSLWKLRLPAASIIIFLLPLENMVAR